MFKFSRGNTCFLYMESCFHCKDPVFTTGISLLVPYSKLYRIAVWLKTSISLSFQQPILRKYPPANQSKNLKQAIYLKDQSKPIIYITLEQPSWQQENAFCPLLVLHSTQVPVCHFYYIQSPHATFTFEPKLLLFYWIQKNK